jgi:hypothetical protein
MVQIVRAALSQGQLSVGRKRSYGKCSEAVAELASE